MATSIIKTDELRLLNDQVVMSDGALTENVTFPAGHVVQVVSENFTGTYTTTATSWQNITGFSATITPKYDTSKIHIQVMLGACSTLQSTLDHGPAFDITRNGNACDLRGGEAGSNIRYAFKGSGESFNADHNPGGRGFIGIDNPLTTDSLTYQVRVLIQNASYPVYINCAKNSLTVDNAHVAHGRAFSNITLMEIKQ
ncbi:MAG: hypothetical protein VW270_00120 [Candidatus Poseidoniales archaeon]